MSTQGIAHGLACRPGAWGDGDCDSGRGDSRMFVCARFVSLQVIVRDLSRSWTSVRETHSGVESHQSNRSNGSTL